MRKILLDTNFLLIPYQFKVDIFAEIDRIIPEAHQLFVIDKTVDELNKIIKDDKQKQKNKFAAALAIQLIFSKDIAIIKTESKKNADDIIAEIEGYTIATQDIELKKRLNCPIITLRAKKKLILA